MHLKQLKLAGFKSFVDPTVINFPSQLVGVVGPNGCGKSNIIDAIRWVMGESSAKNLRGESMIDVIFNGSSQRKPVGQASVELIFDNSLGRLLGQYASYHEIAVKRLVTRDNDSFYFLNGTRCRRRDITDIFLGTGAGARSYSIIGQGTISRIIEARPEELRVFLEEAAGISKYKERRRETLTRIEHTRENLARVHDIRDELDKQLQRLEKQANAAERYQQLKKEEQHCKINILALKWQSNQQEQDVLKNELQQITLNHDQQQTLITHFNCQILLLRNQWEDENANLQTIQSQFYQLSTEIALLKENIEQQKRDKQRLTQDQQQLNTEWQVLLEQINQEKMRLEEGEKYLNTQQTLLIELTQLEKQEVEKVTTLRNQQNCWQENWNTIQKEWNKANQEEQIEQVRLNHLIQQQQDYLVRIEKNQGELQQLDEELSLYQIESLQVNLIELRGELQQEEATYQILQTTVSLQTGQLKEIENNITNVQRDLHQLEKEKAAFAALIQSAFNGSQNNPEVKLPFPKLIEQFTVEEEWHKACEVILGNQLQAYLVDDIQSLLAELTIPTALITEDKSDAASSQPLARLSDKLHGLTPFHNPNFSTIFTVNSFAEACEWLPRLADNESIITQDGHWLSKHWVRVVQLNSNKESVLAHQQSLKKVEKSIENSVTHLSLLNTEQQTACALFDENSLTLSTLQNTVITLREKIKSCENEVNTQRRLSQQVLTKKSALLEENETLLFQREEKVYLQAQSELALTAAKITRQSYETQKATILTEKGNWETSLQICEATLEKIRRNLHENRIEIERQQLICQQATKNLLRAEANSLLLTDKLALITEQIIHLDNKDVSPITLLNDKLFQYQEMEEILNKKQAELHDINVTLEKQGIDVKAHEKEAKISQEKMVQQQLQLQTLRVQSDNLMQSLNELNDSVSPILDEVINAENVANYENNLLAIIEKIKRLGAIKLAAIEEYSIESQRRQHLDDQYNDLMDALTTLDAAIEKMDKETKQRLQHTFDQVNEAFQSLFPRLFGGGSAHLELTCDNLLEAGIIVMAQPPGKRNNTIYLLSGGEKAMTAVALVFAIFQLNPSPFCMLDEVDAPLDDVNVGRFCEVVKEMSQLVQFLFITHNKITMELAEHLIGVTMHEPGTSRIVSVNVEEALADFVMPTSRDLFPGSQDSADKPLKVGTKIDM